VNIPAGVDTGQVVRVIDVGNIGEKGGKKGNLLIQLTVESHQIFKRKGIDLILEHPISFIQAALGDIIKIPLLKNETKEITIKPGTQPDEKIIIRNCGIPNVAKKEQVGNLIVILKLIVPTKLTNKQIEKLKEFEQEK